MHSRPVHALKRLTVVILVAVLVGGCTSSSQPTPAPPGPETAGPSSTGAVPDVPEQTAAPSPVATDEPLLSFPPDDPRSGVAEILIAAPDPLTLSTDVEVENSATEEIGPEGGSVRATGEDGTIYELTIQPNTLPLPIAITMTPLATVSGFPTEAAANRDVGVDLKPHGLVLSVPATLRITPADPFPEDGTFGFSYEREGEEAAFAYFEQADGSLTMEIDHFSGYGAETPLIIEMYRPTVLRQLFTQPEVEARIRSEVAWFMTFFRQRAMVGLPTISQVDFARMILPLIRRLVISPRVAVADRSCADAQAALQAYLEYQRTRQLLGVVENPEFDLVGAGLLVPQALLDLTVRVCFKEAYERCKRLGDFPATKLYYLSVLSISDRSLDAPPSDEALQLAHEYLRKCGRWRVRINTSVNEHPSEYFFLTHEVTREFHVQWESGDGPFSLFNTTITGSGPLEITQLRRHDFRDYFLSDIHSSRDSMAEILYFEWDHYYGPTQTGEPIPPVPSKLRLRIDLGQFTYSGHRGEFAPDVGVYNEYFAWVCLGIVQQRHGRPYTFEDVVECAGNGVEHTWTVTLDEDWQFRTAPFRASLAYSDTVHLTDRAPTPIDVRIEIVVEHDPQ